MQNSLCNFQCAKLHLKCNLSKNISYLFCIIAKNIYLCLQLILPGKSGRGMIPILLQIENCFPVRQESFPVEQEYSFLTRI